MTHRIPPPRLLLYLFAFAIVLGALLQPRRLAAQTCDPTNLTCQPPPDVEITPAGGSWTGTTPTMVLAVTVQFCKAGTYPFSAGGESITLDNQPQSFTNSAVVNGCYTSSGNVTLTLGTHTLVASKTGGGGTGTASATYVYALPPPVPGVAVTPHAATTKKPMSYGTTETFTVSNPGTGTGSYTVQAACSGAAVNCSLSRTTFDLAAGASASVGVNYIPNGAQGATGTVSLKAWLTAQTSVRDSGAYALTVDTLGLRGKLGTRPDMRRLDRDVCVILAAGPGAAFECGDLRLVHGLPGVRLLNRSRAPTLVYSSQHAAPQPIFATWVAPQAGTRPDTIRAALSVNGAVYYARWPGWPSDTTKRVAVMLPVPPATGVYAYTLTITGTWNNGAPAQNISSATSEFVVVNRQASPFGAGWWLAGLEQLVTAGNGRWLWVGGDGSHHVYTPVDASTWVADTYERPDTLKLVDSLLVRRLPGGTEVRYLQNGRHRQTVDPVGKATTFNWSSDYSRLERIDLPVTGYSYAFTYGNDGGTRLSSVASPGAAGTRMTMIATAPDGTGRVTQVTDPDNSFVVFGYTGTDWRVMKRTDRRNWTTRFTYGEGSRLTSSRVPAAVGDTAVTTFRAAEGQGIATAAPSVTTIMYGPRTDVTGDVIQWVLDSYGTPYRVLEPLRGDTYIYRGDPRFPGLVTRIDYSNGRSLTASYDARGNMTASTDWGTTDGSRYATTLFEWDPACDKPTRVTLPEGEVTRRSYNSFCEPNWVQPGGDPARQVNFAYRPLTDATAPGQISSTTLPQLPGQASAPVETYEYDTRGNLSAANSPLGTAGSRTERFSDLVGRDTLTRVRVTSTAWEVTRHLYDVLGRDTLTETIGPALTVNSTPEQRLIVRTRRDAESNVTSVLRASTPDPALLDSVVTRFAYDGMGRRVRETAPDGQKDTTAYDPAGNVTWRRSRRGIQSWTKYDELNRITRRIVDSLSYGPVTREVRLVQNNSRVGAWTFPYYSTAGARLAFAPDTSTFTYDQVGNLRSADNHDARVHRSYYANGQLKLDSLSIRTWAELSAGGSSTQHTYVLQYAYDLSGRRTQLTHPANLAPVNATSGATYTQQSYMYDPVTSGLSRVTSVLGLNYDFFYNLHGQVDSTAYPGGTGERVTYDLDGRIASRTLAGVNYKPGVPGVDVIHQPVYGYSGDHRGKVTSVDESGGDAPLQSDLTLRYSGLGMLVYEQGDVGTGSGATHLNERYAYDALGNRVSSLVNPSAYEAISDFDAATKRLIRTRPPSGVGFVDGTSPQANVSNYDVAGNLEWFQLDNNGGKMYSITRNYYGGDERLRASERWTCALGSYTYVNDTDFSAQCVPPPSLNSATGGAFEDYRYDALGRRVLVRTRRAPYCTSSSCASILTRTVWDGDQLLYEVRAKGGPNETAATLENDGETGAFWGRVAYTHGAGIDEPLDVIRMGYTIQPNDNVDYGFGNWGGPYPIIPLTNWRGVVDAATTADGRKLPCQLGTTCSALVHLPGNLYQAWFSPAELVERKTWFGSLIEESLDATGQMYRRNRYYNPTTGAFTQEDPIGLAGGVNVYGFAGGDPVSYSDPFGLRFCANTPLLRWGVERAVNASIRWDSNGCVSSNSNVSYRGGSEWAMIQSRFSDLVQSEYTWNVTRGTTGHENPLGCGREGHCSWMDSETRTAYIFYSDIDLGDENGDRPLVRNSPGDGKGRHLHHDADAVASPRPSHPGGAWSAASRPSWI